MSMIRVENLTFAYPGSYDNVFENVNFQIDTDWKLGFVARNGRGKTTFLNLLLNKYDYKGKISSYVNFYYFPCEVSDKNKITRDIVHEISKEYNEWELIRELSYLDVREDVMDREFSTLSNGEQTKVLLSALFLNDSRFLLIDEPTNHLDREARNIVANYLRTKTGFILVSHDRAFLDICVDHILSINKADIEVQRGNFTSWYTNFCNKQEYELEQNNKLKKTIEHLKNATMQTSMWADKVEKTKIGYGSCDRGYIGHKAAIMMRRAKAIAKRQEKAIEEKSKLLKNIERVDDLKISPLSYHQNTILRLKNVVAIYYGTNISKPISLEMKQGDRIAIEGKNGSGKTSILKIIHGQNINHSGEVNVSSGLIISYVPQDTSGIEGKLADFANENGIDDTLFKTILRKMDFARIQFEKDIKELSAGQKKKILIAKSLCEKAHLYIWDEPLNYIDIYTRMQIEDLISEFKPSMIFVEHDIAFIKNIATNIIKI